MTITITLAPSEAHLLRAVLDEASKGQAFPIAAYGMAGEAQIISMAARITEAIRATRNPPVAELVDDDQGDDDDARVLEDVTIALPDGYTVPPGYSSGAHWTDPARGRSGWYLVRDDGPRARATRQPMRTDTASPRPRTRSRRNTGRGRRSSRGSRRGASRRSSA